MLRNANLGKDQHLGHLKLKRPNLCAATKRQSQDSGRFDYLLYGVPISGCMDKKSAKIANAILNNKNDCALLEMTVSGGHFLFKANTNICITGADMMPQINKITVKMNTAIAIQKDDELVMHHSKNGCRTYLSITGGFQTPKVLNSRSMYKGITENFRLSKNDELYFISTSKPIKSNATIKNVRIESQQQVIDVYKGPEFDQLTDKQIEILTFTPFTISNESNRMAYPLTEFIPNHLDPIITSIVLPGTVQLTPGGKLIILMRDCQVTGGYPRILQLTEGAINALAQQQVNNQIQFNLL